MASLNAALAKCKPGRLDIGVSTSRTGPHQPDEGFHPLFRGGEDVPVL
jgi:hypothetical protein